MNLLLKEKLVSYQERAEAGITRFLPPAMTRPQRLHAAMRYSLEVGGKRIRPVLVLAASEIFPSNLDPLAAAVAVECLHTYTLIHDDLPSIDNSDLRRGQPACHKQFDEPTAVLAGDALLTYAFQLLSKHYRAEPDLAVALISDLAEASGSEQLIGGQMEDVANEGKKVDADTLKFIHENKTGALLTAALTMGLRFSSPDPKQLQLIKEVGYHLGMTFQIVDDILDVTSTQEVMGKPVGNDSALEKSTYVALHGIEGAQKEAQRHMRQATGAAETLGGESLFLISLIKDLANRVQ